MPDYLEGGDESETSTHYAMYRQCSYSWTRSAHIIPLPKHECTAKDSPAHTNQCPDAEENAKCCLGA